ncbi:MAG: hypothetical protein AAGG53_05295 [Cyanobacteria bacterium P01_H01_bin.152]
MTLPSNVLTKLDTPQWQEHIIELQAAPTLSEMVYRGLQMGLLLARWLLEGELERRAQGPIVWSTCPRCGHRLNSKGWQSRQLQTLIGGLV